MALNEANDELGRVRNIEYDSSFVAWLKMSSEGRLETQSYLDEYQKEN